MNLGKYRFGEFLLDPARRELLRGDSPLRLPPKAFDCLVYLVEHRDRAVGRDELIAAVWGRAEVDDNLLDQAMTRLRRTLDDTDETRRLIRTVPRFGYSWAAPVQAGEEAAGTSQPVSETRAAPAAADASRNAVAQAADAIAEAQRAAGQNAAAAPATPASNATDDRPAAIATRRRLQAALALAALLLLLAGWFRFAGPGRPSATVPTPTADLGLVLPVRIAAEPTYTWARLGVMDLVSERLRAAGQAMVPSDNVVALARQFGSATPAAAELEALARDTSASLVIDAEAEHTGGYWRVALRSVHGRQPALRAEGESQELTDAARAAADRLAAQLGLQPPPENDLLGPRERALAGVLRQADAALLADQIDTARALLLSLDEEQRRGSEVRFRLANLDFRAGRFDAAEAGFQALLQALSPSDGKLLRARVLNALGNIGLRRDDYARAEQLADDVIALLDGEPPSVELGRALTGRANARSAAMRFDDALPDLSRARLLLESVGDRLGLARVDVNFGIVDARRDRFAEALPLLDGAARRLATFHDLTNEVYARVAAGLSRLSLLQPAAALADEPRLAELERREPNPQLRRYIQLARSEILAANGQLAAADALLQDAIAAARADDDPALLGSARVVGLRRALAAGDAATARREADALLSARWAAETPREQGQLWLSLVQAELALQRQPDAAASAARARAWAKADGSAAANVYALLAEAEAAAGAAPASEPDRASISAGFDAALRAAEAGRVPADQLTVVQAYAGWLLRVGEPARAGAIAARSAAWTETVFEAALLQARVHHALNQPVPWRAALLRARHLAGERAIPAELDTLAMAEGSPR